MTPPIEILIVEQRDGTFRARVRWEGHSVACGGFGRIENAIDWAGTLPGARAAQARRDAETTRHRRVEQ